MMLFRFNESSGSLAVLLVAILGTAFDVVVSGFVPLTVPKNVFRIATTSSIQWGRPNSNVSRLFVENDLPEIDFDLMDIPPAADFVEPLISSSIPAVEKLDSSPTTTTTTFAPRSNPTFRAPTPSNQQEYGQAKEMPNTYVRCGTCGSHFAIRPEDLGDRGKGRRLECCVCGNSWFQSKDRVMTLRPGMELVALPQLELERVALNKAEGKPPNFVGDAKLYVGNLAFECSDDMLYQEFSKLGNVGEISMVYDNETGRPRGFAFVTMRTKEDAQKVMAALNGFQIMGRELSIREANN